jgi:S1-C subfamily serine protease
VYLPFICLAAALVAQPASAQNGPCSLKLTAQIVDKNLNVKPVPKLKLSIRETTSTRGIPASTGFDGTTELKLTCGTYIVRSDDPLKFEDKQFKWDLKVTLTPTEATRIELSNDNAEILTVPMAEASGRVQDALAPLFKKYQDSVVTVWSEFGHGTGFFVDDRGLVVTNQHVIGPSEYVAVQIDDDHKIAAVVLAADPEKDVAVLLANRAGLPGSIVAPLARPSLGQPLAIEGERVFTIGSPLNLRKILTVGIVSKLEDRAIISDININPGNSGGPLFNSLGQVIGITTFADKSERTGPCISGIVRVEQLEATLAQAKSKLPGAQVPSERLLPVEPKTPYPLDAIKASVSNERFDVRPYVFSEGDYDMAIITPVLTYHLMTNGEVAAAKEKAKRTRKSKDQAPETFQPLNELRSWQEYVGEYRPVIQVRATPKLRETLGSMFLRGMTSSNGISTIPAKMRFKTDFYKMRLKCGDKEIEPIQPGKVAKVVNVHNYFVNATDASYEGLYTYPADAISPSCGTVSIDLYSEKNPESAKVKELDRKVVERVWADFAPYRERVGNGN